MGYHMSSLVWGYTRRTWKTISTDRNLFGHCFEYLEHPLGHVSTGIAHSPWPHLFGNAKPSMRFQPIWQPLAHLKQRPQRQQRILCRSTYVIIYIYISLYHIVYITFLGAFAHKTTPVEFRHEIFSVVLYIAEGTGHLDQRVQDKCLGESSSFS